MERSLFSGYQRLLQLSLFFVLLLTLAHLSSESNTEEIVCKIERVTVEVKVAGCEPATTVVRACNGACVSAATTMLNPPFGEVHCTSCQPTRYYNKPRTIRFTCNGEAMDKRMYFPFVQECGCANHTSSSNN